MRDLKDAGVAPEAGVLLERLREAIGEETGITARSRDPPAGVTRPLFRARLVGAEPAGRR